MAEANTHIVDFIAYAEKEKGYSTHTVKSYTNDLNRFNQFMVSYTNDPDWTPVDIDRQTIRHFLGSEFESRIRQQDRCPPAGYT
jgi:site-specific recombinase XerD